MSTFSALMPVLETLPGFPPAPEPTVLESLLYLLVWPLAIAIPIFVLGMGPAWFRRSRGATTEVEARRRA